MKICKMADLHLTTKPLDEYRWDFLKWLIGKVEEWKIDRVDILGDLTDKKDHHPEALVNRLVDVLEELASNCQAIYILKGNHDCIDENKPFFRFLSKMPKIKFITHSFISEKEIFLPFTRNIEQWAALKLEQFDCINIHQAAIGALVGNYQLENGFQSDFFKDIKGRIYSGDVHAKQKVGKVEYIGAPYHIDFGDNYEGRIVVIDRGRERSIAVPSIKKLKIDITVGDSTLIALKEVNKDDQVSVVIRLRESEMYNWREIRNKVRQDILGKGALLCSLKFEKIKDIKVVGKMEQCRQRGIETSEQIFHRFCKKEKLAEKAVEVGNFMLNSRRED